MVKNRLLKTQSAQGMVEFALVLPVLLMLLLGIIAFGHLLFFYSFTVSSSREAARWGAAVGTTSNGLPRFRDCEQIRAAAQRTGGIIGVVPAVVSITYDKGPGTPEYAGCPLGGEGPDVALGDRIIIRVNMVYRPIVPVVELPSFPLVGETKRTIIRNLAVADAPTAESPCTETLITIAKDPVQADVGVPLKLTFTVAPATGSGSPSGKFSVTGDNGLNWMGNAPSYTNTVTYSMPGTYLVASQYISTDINFCPSAADMFVKVREPSRTVINLDYPDASIPDQDVMVRVRVDQKDGFGTIAPTGQVTVAVDGTPITCPIDLDASGEGYCYIRFPNTGTYTIRASYPGDVEFGPSVDTDGEPHTVFDPTFILTPSLTPTITLTPGGPVATPEFCPSVAQDIDFSSPDSFFIRIKNPPTGSSPVVITSVRVDWPDVPPAAKLNEIRYSADTSNSCSAASNPSTCIWSSGNGAMPPSLIAPSTGNPWLSSEADRSLAAGGEKELRFAYSRNIPNGDYRLRVTFSNGCTINLSAARSQ